MAGRSLPEESCCGASEPMSLVYKGLKRGGGVLVDTLRDTEVYRDEQFYDARGLKHVSTISESGTLSLSTADRYG
jgi:hypothetical protein